VSFAAITLCVVYSVRLSPETFGYTLVYILVSYYTDTELCGQLVSGFASCSVALGSNLDPNTGSSDRGFRGFLKSLQAYVGIIPYRNRDVFHNIHN